MPPGSWDAPLGGAHRRPARRSPSPGRMMAGQNAGRKPKATEADTISSPGTAAALALETGTRGLPARRQRPGKAGHVYLYVGIPFCPTRCAYCSFVSQSVERTLILVEPYLQALMREIRSRRRDCWREARLQLRTRLHRRRHPHHPDRRAAGRGCWTAVEESFDLSACPEYHGGGRPAGHHHRGKAGGHLAPRRAAGCRSIPRPWRTACWPPWAAATPAAETLRRLRSWCGPVGFPCVNMDLIAGLPERHAGGLPPVPGPVCWSWEPEQHHRPHPGAEKGLPASWTEGLSAPGRGGTVAGHAGLRLRAPCEQAGYRPLLPLPAEVYVRQL